jgi:hypothetical protein
LRVRELVKNGKSNCIHVKAGSEDLYFHSENGIHVIEL